MSTFYKRSRFLFIIFILLFVAILIKLLYIQIWQYESLTDKALQTWNRQLPEKEVPSLVGLSKQVLIRQLDDFTLVWHGSGTKIVEQLPQGGERSPASYYIHVYTD